MIVLGIPGKFISYLDGSSMMQDPEDGLDVACRDAIRKGIHRKTGKGFYVLVTFENEAAAGVLADLADICAVANQDDGDPAEARAARLVLERLARFGVMPV